MRHSDATSRRQQQRDRRESGTYCVSRPARPASRPDGSKPSGAHCSHEAQRSLTFGRSRDRRDFRIEWGPLEIDLLRYRVFAGADYVAVGPTGVRILLALVLAEQEVNARLLSEWVFDTAPARPAATLRVHISNLNAALRGYGVAVIGKHGRYLLCASSEAGARTKQ